MNRTVATDESVSHVVTCAVSEVEDRSITDLPPLNETVDAEALESLLSVEADERPEFDGSIMFEYSDSYIAIWVDSSVTVVVSELSNDPQRIGHA